VLKLHTIQKSLKELLAHCLIKLNRGLNLQPKNVNSADSKIMPIACMMQLQKVSRDSIFLPDKSGSLKRVPHQEYQSEDMLQDIVDRHPELIVGEQINPDAPPGWLVIRREAGIAGSDTEGSRWSVDNF